MDIEFNINQYVRVRLTETGHKIHKEDYDRIYRNYKKNPYPYNPPKEDEDGWSRWQLWTLMELFGSSIHIGINEAPFETNIIFEVENKEVI